MAQQQKIFGLALLGLACSLAACAGPPVPVDQLQSAQNAIGRATDDGADHLAPQDLALAQQKLSNAHAAVSSDHNAEARRLAEQAEADADYAGAYSNVQRIQATASQIQQLQQQNPQ